MTGARLNQLKGLSTCDWLFRCQLPPLRLTTNQSVAPDIPSAYQTPPYLHEEATTIVNENKPNVNI